MSATPFPKKPLAIFAPIFFSGALGLTITLLNIAHLPKSAREKFVLMSVTAIMLGAIGCIIIFAMMTGNDE